MSKNDDDILLLALLFLLGLLGKFKIPIIIPPEKDKDKDKEPGQQEPEPEEQPIDYPEPTEEPAVTPKPTVTPLPTTIELPEDIPEPEPIPDEIPIETPEPIEEPEYNPFYRTPGAYGIPTTDQPTQQPYPDVQPDIPAVEIPPWTQLTLPFSITPEEATRLSELGLDVSMRAAETGIIAFSTATALTAGAYSPALLTAIATALTTAIPAAAQPTTKKKTKTPSFKWEPTPAPTPEPEQPKEEYHNAPSWKWGL